jgi:hypothetical protein
MAGDRRRRFTPFRDFVGPGRRRTDNPTVVATIVLCLGMITLGALLQIVTLFWVGWQINEALEYQKRREGQTLTFRTHFIQQMETVTQIMRRTCLQVATTDDEKTECLAPLPTPPAEAPRKRK